MMLNVTVGQKVHVVSSKKRADGLVETQEVVGTITKVDAFTAEYEVTERLSGENVLMPLTSGGFNRALSPAQLAKFSGITILEG